MVVNRAWGIRPPNTSAGARRAAAGAVEGNADGWFAPAVLGHAGGDVSVMVLDWDALQSGLQGPACGGVVGMKIVSNDCRSDSEKTGHGRQSLFKHPL